MTRTKGKPLSLYQTYKTARSYQLRGENWQDGWALCTVNDKTGELIIVSDWGNWAFLWNPAHLGRPSLTHFIGDRSDYDYLACKLLGGQRAATVIDVDKTIARWRRQLAENRLRMGREIASGGLEPLTADLAREIWEALGELRDYESNESIFLERAAQIEEHAWFSECPWDDVLHRPSHEYLVLCERILPALAAACRETTAQAALVAGAFAGASP